MAANNSKLIIMQVLSQMILILILIMISRSDVTEGRSDLMMMMILDRPCDEIYVVGEGETLHTISDKCGDPFIVEQNPHIQDPDDVFPGLVIKITPTTTKSQIILD